MYYKGKEGDQLPIYENTELTPREYILMEAEKEEARLAREHAVTMKQLEIELAKEKNHAEVQLKKMESRVGSLLKLPLVILKLPLYLLLGLGYIVFAIRGENPPTSFWSLIK